MTARVLLTLPTGELAGVSLHAIDRWREYTCPMRPYWWAVQLLEHVVELAGELTDEKPSWVTPEGDHGEAGQRYLLIGDFALIVASSDGGPAVVTVIARGGLPPRMRLARNSAAAARRKRRAARRRHDDARGGARARRRALRLAVDDQGDE